MKNLSKTKTFIALGIILTSLLMANFSFAQEPTIAPGEFTNAAANVSACENAAFRDRVNQFFQALDSKPNLTYTTRFKEAPSSFSQNDCLIITVDAQGNEEIVDRDNLLQYSLRYTEEPLTPSGLKTLEASRQNEASWWAKILDFVLSAIFNALALIFGFLANFAGWVLTKIVTATTSGTIPEIVNNGWLIVRDFMNMFFILALIAISIGTILRIEAYNYRRLLVRLILMALLINFSLVIGKQIIQLFDVLLLAVAGNGDFFNYSEFADLLIRSKSLLGDAGVLSNLSIVFAGVMSSFLGMIFAFIAMLVLAALAGLLLIRMIGLWVLLILSPVAYAFYILPATTKYAQAWWSTFFKYLIWGPVAIFFVKLANGLIIAQADEPLLGANSMFDFALISGFMLASFLVAKKAGMVGASAVTNLTEKGFGKGKAAGMFAFNASRKGVARGAPLRGAGIVLKQFGLKSGAERLKTAGDRVGAGTAAVQAKVRQYQESFALGDRNREKQISGKTMDMLLNSKGGDLDKDLIGKLSKEQLHQFAIKQFAKTGGDSKEQAKAVENVDKFLEHGGRKAGDAFMAVVAHMDKNGQQLGDGFRESVMKSYATSRGVREYEFERDKEKYLKLKPKLIGSVKAGDELTKEDKRSLYVYMPNQKTLDNLTPNEIGALTTEQLQELDREVKKISGDNSESRIAAEVSKAIRNTVGYQAAGTNQQNNGAPPPADSANPRTSPPPPPTA